MSDDDRTAPPTGHRGKGTTQIELERINAEREVALAKVRAQEHTSWGEALREARPLLETCGRWTAAVLLVLGVIVLGYVGRGAAFSAFGIEFATGAAEEDSP